MKKCKMKIQIADDDRAIQEAMTFMLEDAGYDVISTTDGETIPVLRAQKPNLLLLDIWMSGVDGRDICKQLKKQKKTKHTPIIMISANRDTQQIAKDSGADDFISKPFQMNDLLSKVANHIRVVE